MKVLITGSKGFLGQNMIKVLNKEHVILEYNRNNTYEDLRYYCQEADIVFHFAAVLRPNVDAVYAQNISLTKHIIELLRERRKRCPLVFSSSIQVLQNNAYGISKRYEEELVCEYGNECNVEAYVVRFPNLFGTMSKPNYTSVVSTFVFNTILGNPITINNPGTQMKLAFVEDVLCSIKDTICKREKSLKNDSIIEFEDYYSVGLGELAYYMQTLKNETIPKICRADDFYDKLRFVYDWYSSNYKSFIG